MSGHLVLSGRHGHTTRTKCVDSRWVFRSEALETALSNSLVTYRKSISGQAPACRPIRPGPSPSYHAACRPVGARILLARRTTRSIAISWRASVASTVWWSFAYCLTPNHVHLILVPDREEALGRARRGAPALFVDHQHAAQGGRPSLPGAVSWRIPTVHGIGTAPRLI